MPRVLPATKHFQVTQKLRKQILKLKSKDYVPTAAELTSMLGASHGTVVKALAKLRDEGVIYRQTGRQRYQVATITDRPLGRVVIVRPEYPSPDLDSVVSSIIDAGKERRWAFSLQTFSSLDCLDLNWIGKGQDAVVLLPSTEDIPSYLLTALRRPRRPVLLVQQHIDFASVANISIDDTAVGRLAVDYLHSRGHHRLMVVIDQAFDSTIRLRLQGWRNAMRSRGVSDLDALIFDSGVQPFENAMEKTYAAFSELLKTRKTLDFTGIFCTSSVGAIAVLRALRENNIDVPGQMSVIAYSGESGIAPFLYPALTSIEANFSKFGQEAVTVLGKLLEDDYSCPMHKLITPFLIPRQTTD